MGYVFERSESVGDAVRRVAIEELDAALADLRGERPRFSPTEAVHDCRKRCKKVRGLVRLMRPVLGRDYALTNAGVRDAARELSGTRDAQALAITFTKMLEHSGGDDDERYVSVGHALDDASSIASESVDQQAGHVARAIELLSEVRHNVDHWPLDGLGNKHNGFGALRPGLTATYREARRAMAECNRDPSPEAFHEWRKHAKYGWYHLRLIQRSAPSVLEPLSDVFGALADTLGDAHDLAALTQRVRDDPRHYGRPSDVDATLELIDRSRAELDRRALGAGARLYAERPKAFAGRMETYWRTWHRFGDEPRIGSIDVVLDDTVRVEWNE